METDVTYNLSKEFFDEVKSHLEALLFASDEPASLKTLSEILGEYYKNGDKTDSAKSFLNVENLQDMITDLNQKYNESKQSFQIIEIAGGFQFATLGKFAKCLGLLFKEKSKRRLSQSALEALAVIAFKQPISKPDIENIRGVNSDYVISTLLEKNLVCIIGRAETVGRPLLYGTTKEFLKHFGLKSIADLPKLKEINELLNNEEFQLEVKRLEGSLLKKEKGDDENGSDEISPDSVSSAEDNNGESQINIEQRSEGSSSGIEIIVDLDKDSDIIDKPESDIIQTDRLGEGEKNLSPIEIDIDYAAESETEQIETQDKEIEKTPSEKESEPMEDITADLPSENEVQTEIVKEPEPTEIEESVDVVTEERIESVQETTSSEIVSSVEETPEVIEETSNKMEEPVEVLAEDVIEPVQETTPAEIISSVEGITEVIEEKPTEMEEAPEVIEETSDKIEESVESLTEEIIEPVQETTPAEIISSVEGITEVIEEKPTEIEEAPEVIEETSNKIEESVEALTEERIEPVQETTPAEIISSVEGITEVIEEKPTEIEEAPEVIEETSNEIEESVEALTEEIIESVQETTPAEIISSVEGITEVIEEKPTEIEEAPEVIEETSNEIEESVEALTEEVIEPVQETTSSEIVSSVEETQEVVNDETSIEVEELIGTITEEIIEPVQATTPTEIISSSEAVAEVIEENPTEIEEPIEEAPEVTEEVHEIMEVEKNEIEDNEVEIPEIQNEIQDTSNISPDKEIEEKYKKDEENPTISEEKADNSFIEPDLIPEDNSLKERIEDDRIIEVEEIPPEPVEETRSQEIEYQDSKKGSDSAEDSNIKSVEQKKKVVIEYIDDSVLKKKTLNKGIRPKGKKSRKKQVNNGRVFVRRVRRGLKTYLNKFKKIVNYVISIFKK
jgi:segregation and condensation protein B